MLNQFTKIKLIILFSFSLLTVQAQLKKDNINYYVALNGNDQANGLTQATAFATIEQARNSIRELKRTGQLTKPVTVFIGGGIYHLDHTISFNGDDSGTAEFPITYTSLPSQSVTLSGDIAVQGWQLGPNGIWKAKLPLLPGNKPYQFRQIFVNDSARQIARLPDTGFFRANYTVPPKGRKSDDYTWFKYFKNELQPTWKNIADVEVVAYQYWMDIHLKIKSIDTDQSIVNFQYRANKPFTDDKSALRGARYIVQNVWEGMHVPGRWFIDRKENTVYYHPYPGEDMHKINVIVPVVPELLHLEGNTADLKPVAYLNFKGITFTYNAWNLPEGDTNIGQGSCGVGGCITLAGAQYCEFQNCTIHNISSFAFDLQKGSSYNKITGCKMTNLGAGGIKINGGTDDGDPLLLSGHEQITNNVVSNYGVLFSSAVGIYLQHTGNNLVSHNDINNGYYTGISVGFTFGYVRSTAHHNIIEYNRIAHIGKGLLSDMGGIYTLGFSPGTIIRNNVIHDVRAYSYGGWGIYNDEGSSEMLIENNVVYNTQFAPYNIHYSRNQIVRNNIFAFGEKAQVSRTHREIHQSVFFEGNIVYWKKGELLADDWRDSTFTIYRSPRVGGWRTETSTFVMDHNLYYNPGLTANTINFNGQTRAEWNKRGKDVHSIYADPLFIDPEHFDFRLKVGSPAYRLGFKDIDVSTVGAFQNTPEK